MPISKVLAVPDSSNLFNSGPFDELQMASHSVPLCTAPMTSEAGLSSSVHTCTPSYLLLLVFF